MSRSSENELVVATKYNYACRMNCTLLVVMVGMHVLLHLDGGINCNTELTNMDVLLTVVWVRRNDLMMIYTDLIYYLQGSVRMDGEVWTSGEV